MVGNFNLEFMNMHLLLIFFLKIFFILFIIRLLYIFFYKCNIKYSKTEDGNKIKYIWFNSQKSIFLLGRTIIYYGFTDNIRVLLKIGLLRNCKILFFDDKGHLIFSSILDRRDRHLLKYIKFHDYDNPRRVLAKYTLDNQGNISGKAVYYDTQGKKIFYGYYINSKPVSIWTYISPNVNNKLHIDREKDQYTPLKVEINNVDFDLVELIKFYNNEKILLDFIPNIIH